MKEFTSESLREFDGTGGKPIYISVLGIVYDCTSSPNIHAESGYGKLWGGRDATYALALGSLKIEDSNKLDFDSKDFQYKEQRSLRLYEEHFKTKYPVVGKLAGVGPQIKDLPPLEDLPEKYEPREVPPLQKRKLVKLSVAQSNKVCHAAGFQNIDEACYVGDLSDAMFDAGGRERLEEVATSVDVPFREVKDFDENELAVTCVEYALEYKGQRNLQKGTEVFIRGCTGRQEEFNNNRGVITEVKPSHKYEVKLSSSFEDPETFKAENVALW